MDYYSQQQLIQRQRRLADMLRQAAEAEAGYKPNQGQMISGHYVAPSWSQNLSNLVAPMAAENRARQAEQQAAQQEQAYGTAVDRARQSWQSALPRTIAGHPELQGPQAEGGSPELAAVPTQLPDRASVLKHTLAGMDIPGNEKSAALWNQGMSQEIEREDKQQEFAAMQAERLQQQRALQMERLAAQEAQLRERLQQQERQNIRDNETRAAHQQVMLQMAQLRADAARDAATIRAEAKSASSKADAVEAREVQKDIKALSTRMDRVTPVLGAAKEVQQLLDKYTDPKTGEIKSIPGIGYIGALPGWARSAGQEVGLISKETNANRATVQRLINNIVRAQAGLSQTISEQAKQIEANLSSGSYSQADFSKAFNQLLQDLEYDINNVRAGHRPEATETYLKRGGMLDLPTPNPSYVGPTTPVSAKRARLEELKRKQAGGQ